MRILKYFSPCSDRGCCENFTFIPAELDDLPTLKIVLRDFLSKTAKKLSVIIDHVDYTLGTKIKIEFAPHTQKKDIHNFINQLVDYYKNFILPIPNETIPWCTADEFLLYDTSDEEHDAEKHDDEKHDPEKHDDEEYDDEENIRKWAEIIAEQILTRQPENVTQFQEDPYSKKTILPSWKSSRTRRRECNLDRQKQYDHLAPLSKTRRTADEPPKRNQTKTGKSRFFADTFGKLRLKKTEETASSEPSLKYK